MSSHRLSAAAPNLRDEVLNRTQSLAHQQVLEALPEKHRHLLDGNVAVEMTHLSKGVITSGNRAAVFATLDVLPNDDTGRRTTTWVLVSWTFHTLHGLRMDLDRIEPVED